MVCAIDNAESNTIFFEMKRNKNKELELRFKDMEKLYLEERSAREECDARIKTLMRQIQELNTNTKADNM